MLQALAGLAILIIAVFIGFKLIKGMFKIGLLLALFLLGSYLLFGGLPSLQGMLSGEPASGDIAPGGVAIPEDSRVKDIIVTAKNIAWGVEIVSAAWDSDGTLLIALVNTGQFPLSGIRVWVNGDEVTITNTLSESLEKGDAAILDTDYMARGPMAIRVEAGEAEDEITANP